MATAPTSRPRSVRLARKPKHKPRSAAELFANARLFAVVIVKHDGTEELQTHVIQGPTAAAKSAAGITASLAHLGKLGEAREIDPASLKFTGRKFGPADLRHYKLPQVAAKGGAANA